MMIPFRTSQVLRQEQGFTFFEVMVSLIIGTLIAGGVMGIISISLQFTQRVKDKTQVLPVLEAVAEEILANPQSAQPGTIVLKDYPDAPPVEVFMAEVEDGGLFESARMKSLRRVQLRCRGQMLEFSVLLPSEIEGLPPL